MLRDRPDLALHGQAQAGPHHHRRRGPGGFRRALPWPKGAQISPDTLGGISGEWATSKLNAAGTLLYLHGGGYFAGSPRTHRSITGAYAVRGFSVFSRPITGLPRKHPFPAALDDALAVYRACWSAFLPASSRSAGIPRRRPAWPPCSRPKAGRLPMPACALVFSPWTDLAATGASVNANARPRKHALRPQAHRCGGNLPQRRRPSKPAGLAALRRPGGPAALAHPGRRTGNPARRFHPVGGAARRRPAWWSISPSGRIFRMPGRSARFPAGSPPGNGAGRQFCQGPPCIERGRARKAGLPRCRSGSAAVFLGALHAESRTFIRTITRSTSS